MADTPFSYLPSQQIRKDLSFGRYNWKIAEDQYKQGQYLESFYSVLSYIDETVAAKFKNDPEAGVNVPHGSMQMFITVYKGELQILAPFVDIANAQKLVILRKICEINFNVLSLAKIECKEDKLSFLYRCPLEACEPWKIYDVLKEICWSADKYDDDFVVMHGASWVYQSVVTMYSPERQELAWKGFKQTLQEAKEWIGYWKQLGYAYVAWDVIYIALMKIEYIAAPRGTLKNFIDRTIDMLFEKRDINDVVNEGISSLESLDKMPKEAFCTQLYDVSTFIPVKITGSAVNIQDSLKVFLTDAYNYITKNEIISAYLWLQKAVYRLLYNYRFNEAQWKQLQTILSVDTTQPIAVVTNKLYEQLNQFYTNPLDQVVTPAPDKKEEKKGLFSSWFS